MKKLNSSSLRLLKLEVLTVALEDVIAQLKFVLFISAAKDAPSFISPCAIPFKDFNRIPNVSFSLKNCCVNPIPISL